MVFFQTQVGNNSICNTLFYSKFSSFYAYCWCFYSRFGIFTLCLIFLLCVWYCYSVFGIVTLELCVSYFYSMFDKFFVFSTRTFSEYVSKSVRGDIFPLFVKSFTSSVKNVKLQHFLRFPEKQNTNRPRLSNCLFFRKPLV